MGRPKKAHQPHATAIIDPEALHRERAVENQIRQDEDTIVYGESDAFPLKLAKLVSESPVTSACIDTKAKYIKGASFSDKNLMSIKVDKYGTTLWQFHSMLSEMLSLFEGFAVRFTYDYNLKITNAYILNFESTRLKKPDDKGFINAVKYNPYFGTQEYKKELTCEYPMYNKGQVQAQIEKDGNKYAGQVYYYGETSPLYRFYPMPKYWSAKDWIRVDGEIQKFHANNLENNFFISVIFNQIGDPGQPSSDPKHQETYTDENNVKRKRSTKTIGQAFNDEISTAFAGAKKSGVGMAIWSKTAAERTDVQAFPTNANADLFNALQEQTDEKITQATQVPGILANIQRGVNLGSGGSEIQKTVELMQSRVVEDQTTLEQFYNEVLLPDLVTAPQGAKVKIQNFYPVTTPVEIEDKFWEVMTPEEKREFVRINVPNAIILPGATQTTTTVDPGQVTTAAEANPLKDLPMDTVKKILSITNRYNRKLQNPEDKQGLTRQQAEQFLASYGLSEEYINMFLNDTTNTTSLP